MRCNVLGSAVEPEQLRWFLEICVTCCSVAIAKHEPGGSVEDSLDEDLRPNLKIQPSPHSRRLRQNGQSVSKLAQSSRAVKL